ncbi:MAG: hypothetical protein HeimC3_17880 [Candidatus Heimdallarchaeota archaeon LC_3]|nr:MAG: hypothetical protein HeimC3_17880 [Candidatus Heimdallarchaeota archaeon LC_3]
MQSGFIAALFQFSLEFGQKSIREVEFEDGKMIFELKKVNDRELLFVFFTTCEPSGKELRPVVQEASNAFIKKYSKIINESADIVNSDDFKTFSDTLFDLKLINRRPMKSIPLMKRKSFLDRLLRR